MKSSQSDWHRNPAHSPSARGFPFSTKLADPGETLLVVDDDEMIRDFESRVLRLEGYNVLQAEGVAKALRLAQEAAAIHLLITDFSMPEFDGLELTHRFRAVRPKIPVLMVSGSLASLDDRVRNLERFECMAKPFTHNELLRKVRTLLDAAAPLPRRTASGSHQP